MQEVHFCSERKYSSIRPYLTFRHQLPPPQSLRERSYHSVALHVARRANGFVVLHHVRLPSKDAVTVETAEVLQMPVVALGLRVLVTEDQLRTRVRVRREVKVWPSGSEDESRSHLIAACTSRLLAVPVVASAVQLAFLPEVDHVHQQLFAGAAHEAGRVPQLVVTGPLGVDSRLAQTHRLHAVLARLEKQ